MSLLDVQSQHGFTRKLSLCLGLLKDYLLVNLSSYLVFFLSRETSLLDVQSQPSFTRKSFLCLGLKTVYLFIFHLILSSFSTEKHHNLTQFYKKANFMLGLKTLSSYFVFFLNRETPVLERDVNGGVSSGHDVLNLPKKLTASLLVLVFIMSWESFLIQPQQRWEAETFCILKSSFQFNFFPRTQYCRLVSAPCLVTLTMHTHKPKFLAKLWDSLDVSSEFPAPVSADSLLSGSRAMKLGSSFNQLKNLLRTHLFHLAYS